MWLQQIVNGLTIGVVYALLGMGFSMVWATARTLNFATGAVYTTGSFLVFVVAVVLGVGGGTQVLPVLLAILALGMLLGVILGYLLDRGIFRPLRNVEMAPLFASMGVGIALENVYVFIFGPRPTVVQVSGARSFYQIGSASVTLTQIIILILSVLLMAALHMLLKRSAMGRAMRATAWDRTAAQLKGIDVNKVIALMFMIVASIGVVAGSFVGLFYGIMDPYMGLSVSIKGLAAAIFGGFGNIPGAIVGGLIIGILEAFGAAVTTSGNWQDVFAYAILILVIVFRPQGLFPERTQRGD
ncbi:MAG: branched-chain amino acid ABC transporter permease [Firmicutes bacterium]|nr:branched-chain amino acid ABC transporter permease [Bacillota bacterium]